MQYTNNDIFGPKGSTKYNLFLSSVVQVYVIFLCSSVDGRLFCMYQRIIETKRKEHPLNP
jgi:hypothetical protein